MNGSSPTRRPDRSEPRKLDLSRSLRSFLAAWGPPILLILAGDALAKAVGTPALGVGLLWSAGIIWSGLSCARNALRCGRFHCTVLGIAHPLLGLAALAITLHIVTIGWNPFWSYGFWPVTVAAFVPELFGVRYLGHRTRGRTARGA